MRKLTRTELVSEISYRLAIRGIYGKCSTQIVELVAEMIELARERVPDCYEQATPARTCPRCGGRCGGDC